MFYVYWLHLEFGDFILLTAWFLCINKKKYILNLIFNLLGSLVRIPHLHSYKLLIYFIWINCCDLMREWKSNTIMSTQNKLWNFHAPYVYIYIFNTTCCGWIINCTPYIMKPIKCTRYLTAWFSRLPWYNIYMYLYVICMFDVQMEWWKWNSSHMYFF